MKLTRNKLKQIIKEELEEIVSEVGEMSPAEKFLSSADERQAMLKQLADLEQKQVEIYRTSSQVVKTNPDEALKMLDDAKILEQQIKSIKDKLYAQWDEYSSSYKKPGV